MIPVLLALYLHHSAALIQAVYAQGGLDVVAVVECESNFNPRAVRHEPRGFTSWGLFQIDDEWHPQYRGNLQAHICYGVAFLRQCEARAHGNYPAAVSIYNSGSSVKSLAWGKRVEQKRDALARWLSWWVLWR